MKNANFEKLENNEKLPNFFQILTAGIGIGIMLLGLTAYLLKFYSIILR
jgi:hypothetical protein